ncbi:MAG: hypothetical protein LBO69_09785 [Ignavibacteria bacterium]|jgi:hypothetical protein|nr:hypothetical protein [Ignavibacteria bacterium]
MQPTIDMNYNQNIEIDALQQDLLNLMLNKAGLKYEELVISSIKKWVGQNIDLLSSQELERYKNIIV